MVIKDTDITMIRGDSETIIVAVKDVNENKIELENGDTIYLTIKGHPRDEKKILQKIITIFDEGKAIIEIEPEDTKHCKFKDYFYDIQLTDKNGRVTTIIPPSKFTIESEVTYE